MIMATALDCEEYLVTNLLKWPWSLSLRECVLFEKSKLRKVSWRRVFSHPKSLMIVSSSVSLRNVCSKIMKTTVKGIDRKDIFVDVSATDATIACKLATDGSSRWRKSSKMSFTSIALAVIFNNRLFSTSIHAPCWLERACLIFFPDWTSKKILNSTQRGERPLSRTVGTHEAQLRAKLYVLWRVLIKFICSVCTCTLQWLLGLVALLKVEY